MSGVNGRATRSSPGSARSPRWADAARTWHGLSTGVVGRRPDHPVRRLGARRSGSPPRSRTSTARPSWAQALPALGPLLPLRRRRRPRGGERRGAGRGWRPRARRRRDQQRHRRPARDRGQRRGDGGGRPPGRERLLRARHDPEHAACEVAIDLGVHGPVNASALACASGNAAILEARRLILSGEADAVIAGGTDASITRVMFAGLANIGAAVGAQRRPRAGQPALRRRSRRLRLRRGRGRLRRRVRRAGARPAARGSTARWPGGALTADALHVVAPEPSGAHAARAITLALERAGVAPRGRLHLRPRHGHPGQRRRRDAGHPRRSGRGGRRRCPSARRSRWSAISSRRGRRAVGARLA